MTRARGRRWARALGVLALFVLAFWLTGCDPAVFWARRAHLRDIVSQLFPPDWSYLSAIVAPLLATLRMSVTGTALGVLLALILAPLCAANLPCPAPVRRILRFLVQVLRSFPALILALLATFLFGLGTFSGTVAITLFTLAVMTRMTYEDIETLTLAPYRALCAMGASPARAYARAVVPEIASGYLTNALYLLETNVRHSAILGYVGAGGIGLLLNEKISWREYGRVGAILVCLFVTVCCIEWLSHVLGRIIRGERSIPRGAKRAIWAAVLVCVVVCTAGIEAPDLAHTSKSVLAAMGTGLLHPDWSFFFGTGKDGLGWLLLETVGIALAGTGLGALLALPLAFLSTPKLLPRPVALLFRVLIVAIRSVPFLIYGLIFIRVSGPGAFTGVLTLAVCSIGLLSKRFTEAIESLDFRAYDALRAMGVSLLPRIRYAVLPQLGPAFSSAVLYRFDVNIREASVLGLVGEVDYLRQLHVTGGFLLHLFIVHHDFTVENLLLYPFIEVVRYRPHEHALREVGYFAGRYQAVHLGAYRGGLLPLVNRHTLPFLQYLSETLGKDFRRFTDHLTAEHVTHRILYHPALLVPIVTGKLAVILKT